MGGHGGWRGFKITGMLSCGMECCCSFDFAASSASLDFLHVT